MPLLSAPVYLLVFPPAPLYCSRHTCEMQCPLISEAMLLGSTCTFDDVVPDCDRHACPLNMRSPYTKVTHLSFCIVVCPWMTVLYARKNLKKHTVHYIITALYILLQKISKQQMDFQCVIHIPQIQYYCHLSHHSSATQHASGFLEYAAPSAAHDLSLCTQGFLISHGAGFY